MIKTKKTIMLIGLAVAAVTAGAQAEPTVEKHEITVVSKQEVVKGTGDNGVIRFVDEVAMDPSFVTNGRGVMDAKGDRATWNFDFAPKAGSEDLFGFLNTSHFDSYFSLGEQEGTVLTDLLVKNLNGTNGQEPFFLTSLGSNFSVHLLDNDFVTDVVSEGTFLDGFMKDAFFAGMDFSSQAKTEAGSLVYGASVVTHYDDRQLALPEYTFLKQFNSFTMNSNLEQDFNKIDITVNMVKDGNIEQNFESLVGQESAFEQSLAQGGLVAQNSSFTTEDAGDDVVLKIHTEVNGISNAVSSQFSGMVAGMLMQSGFPPNVTTQAIQDMANSGMKTMQLSVKKEAVAADNVQVVVDTNGEIYGYGKFLSGLSALSSAITVEEEDFAELGNLQNLVYSFIRAQNDMRRTQSNTLFETEGIGLHWNTTGNINQEGFSVEFKSGFEGYGSYLKKLAEKGYAHFDSYDVWGEMSIDKSELAMKGKGSIVGDMNSVMDVYFTKAKEYGNADTQALCDAVVDLKVTESKGSASFDATQGNTKGFTNFSGSQAVMTAFSKIISGTDTEVSSIVYDIQEAEGKQNYSLAYYLDNFFPGESAEQVAARPEFAGFTARTAENNDELLVAAPEAPEITLSENLIALQGESSPSPSSSGSQEGSDSNNTAMLIGGLALLGVVGFGLSQSKKTDSQA